MNRCTMTQVYRAQYIKWRGDEPSHVGVRTQRRTQTVTAIGRGEMALGSAGGATRYVEGDGSTTIGFAAGDASVAPDETRGASTSIPTSAAFLGRPIVIDHQTPFRRAGGISPETSSFGEIRVEDQGRLL